MRKVKLVWFILTISLLSVSCGQQDSDSVLDSDSYTDYNSAPTGSTGALTGTAAVGAPVPNGIVKIKCSDQTLPDAATDAFGKWSVDVNGCTAPYLIRVKGSVGGKDIDLLSAADTEDVGAIVNVTPITHMVVANMIGDADPGAFDSLDVGATVSKANINAQKVKVKLMLENVIKAATKRSNIDDLDIMNTPFATDHSGLDAVLDVIKVEVDGAADTIDVKLADGTVLFQDDATTDADNNSAVSVDSSKVDAIVKTYTSVDTVLRSLIKYVQANASAINTSQSNSDLPSGHQLVFHSSFLDRGMDVQGALHEWFGLNSMTEYRAELEGKQADFANVNIILDESDSTKGMLFFDFILDGKLVDKAINLAVAQESGLWKLYGDQIPFEFWAGVTIVRELRYASSTPSAVDKIQLEANFKEGSQVDNITQIKISNSSDQIIAQLDLSFEDWDGDGVHDVSDGEPSTISNGQVVRNAYASVDLDATLKGYFDAGALGEYKLEFLDAADSVVGEAKRVFLGDPNRMNHSLMPAVTVSTPSGDVDLAANGSNLASFCDTSALSFDVTIGQTEMGINSVWAHISGDSGGNYEYNDDQHDDESSASGKSFTVDASSAGLSVSARTGKQLGLYFRSASDVEYAYDIRCEI